MGVIVAEVVVVVVVAIVNKVDVVVVQHGIAVVVAIFRFGRQGWCRCRRRYCCSCQWQRRCRCQCSRRCHCRRRRCRRQQGVCKEVVFGVEPLTSFFAFDPFLGVGDVVGVVVGFGRRKIRSQKVEDKFGKSETGFSGSSKFSALSDSAVSY